MVGIKATRYAELSYEHVAVALWRFVDNATGRHVGPAYKMQTELLADVERFAGVFGAADAPATVARKVAERGCRCELASRGAGGVWKCIDCGEVLEVGE